MPHRLRRVPDSLTISGNTIRLAPTRGFGLGGRVPATSTRQGSMPKIFSVQYGVPFVNFQPGARRGVALWPQDSSRTMSRCLVARPLTRLAPTATWAKLGRTCPFHTERVAEKLTTVAVRDFSTRSEQKQPGRESSPGCFYCEPTICSEQRSRFLFKSPRLITASHRDHSPRPNFGYPVSHAHSAELPGS